MPGDSSVRNRSEIVIVTMPRGRIEVARQETRGLRGDLGWRGFWVAHRVNQKEWVQAETAREAIRRAALLPPRKHVGWLAEGAAQAEREILENPGADTDPPATETT